MLFAAVGVMTALIGCDRDPSFTIRGEVKGANHEMLYFEHTGMQGIETLDSVTLNTDGDFKFSAVRPESPEFYRLRIGQKIINIAIDSTETVDVTADLKNFTTGYMVTGSPDNLKIKELVNLQAGLQQQLDKVSNAGLPIGVARDSVAKLVNTYKQKVVRNYIYAAPNKPSAYFALFQEFNGYMIFDPINNKEDVKCFAAVATSLNNAYPHADRSRNLYNMVIKGMKNTRAPKVEPLQIPQDKVSEASIIDIPLNDLRGVTRHLTDFKGKVVLINFIAYGEQSSGAYNLALRELYKKYSGQGFEIFQISLDPDEHFWKTAADNLPWICVRDPQGPYSTYVNLYGVTQLPATFLVNRENELSLRVGPKTDLEAAISKLL